MKKLNFYLTVMAFVFALFSCKKEENDQQTKGSAQFSFDQTQLKSAKADTVANAAAVVVTVEDLNGKTLYNNERIDLYNMNGYYISKPISLVPGSYKLTKFMVVDANNNVLYVTPMEGSAKAYLVTDPLPIDFSVTKNNVTKVVPQVISATGSTPEDFGYATFSFDVVKTFDFLIGVFAYNESTQNFEMTTAHLSIAADSGWVYEKDVPAATDTITVKDNQSRYILTVTKDGYNTWTDTLTASELKLFYNSKDKGPLEVILSKQNLDKISFITNQDTLKQVTVQINGLPNTTLKLMVNWGDGTSENINGVNNITINHNFTIKGLYQVTIYGSIENLMDLFLNSIRLKSLDVRSAKNLNMIVTNNNPNLTSLDLSNLQNLGLISCRNTNVDSINTSNSEKLEVLLCSNSKIKRIDLSQKPILHIIDLSYNLLETSDVNRIYIDLLQSLQINPRNGQIYISPSPTGEGQVAMNEIINQYGWTVKNVSF